MNKKFFWVGLGVLLLALAVVVISALQQYRFHGSLIEPAQPAPEIELNDQFGNVFSLAAQKSKINLVFFGYTNCPDVCPATLSEYRQLEQRLAEQSSKVNFVYVTVDPRRDTPDRLKQFLAVFSPQIKGLSGAEDKLSEVWQRYGVVRQIRTTDSPGIYFVDHTSRIYVIDRGGNLRLTFAFGTIIDDMLSDIRYLLGEK